MSTVFYLWVVLFFYYFLGGLLCLFGLFCFYFKGLERTWWLSAWTSHFFYVHEIMVYIEAVDVLLCRHVGSREG